MEPQKNVKKTSATTANWYEHDSYQPAASFNRIVTRSQTAFIRLKNTPSDLDLFADLSRHHPPHLPHLMGTLKGEYGSIPRTIITRSYGKHIGVDDTHCKKLDEYKSYKPTPEDKINIQNEIDKHRRGSKKFDKGNRLRKGKRRAKNEDEMKKDPLIEELKIKQAEYAERKKEQQPEEKEKETKLKAIDEEAERQRKDIEDELKKQKEAEEAETKKKEAEEAERKKKEAEETERKQKEAEEEENKVEQAEEE